MAEESRPTVDVAQLILGGRGSLYPGSEAEYWRETYTREPYYEAGRSFEDYGPAYELGWTGYSSYGGEFETADRVLANDWTVQKGVSTLSWEEARAACRAAWQRAHNANTYMSDGSAAPDQAIQSLKELAVHAHDGELGYREVAAQTEAPALHAFLERRAQECRDCAAELHEQIVRLGGEASAGGTVTAAAHRAWFQIRGLFGGAKDEALMADCLRAQEAALSDYRKALQQNLPQEIHAMVQRQFEIEQRNHDAMKTLLNRARALAEAGSG
jgi:uncharacterized protein (TIGR02284 family)